MKWEIENNEEENKALEGSLDELREALETSNKHGDENRNRCNDLMRQKIELEKLVDDLKASVETGSVDRLVAISVPV